MTTQSPFESYDNQELSVGQMVYQIAIQRDRIHILEFKIMSIDPPRKRIMIFNPSLSDKEMWVPPNAVHTNPKALADLWESIIKDQVIMINLVANNVDKFTVRYSEPQENLDENVEI